MIENNLEGKKVLILGFSLTGVASAKYFVRQGARVFISEFSQIDEKDRELLNEVEKLGIKTEFGGHSDEFINNADFCILSPSIPTDAPIISRLKEKNIPFFSDIEYIAKNYPDKIVLVTGTNGKTTTTALTSHILSEKYQAPSCGNIGVSPMDYLDKNIDYFIIEASSYQLYYCNTIKPKVGIFCNLTPDHILWHKTIENYFDAKAKPFRNMSDDDWAILNYDDSYTRKLGEEIKAKVIYFSTSQELKDGIYLKDNKIIFKDREIIDVNELNIVGNHNVQNAMCAIVASYILNIDFETIKKSLKSFKAINHRLEFIRTIDGTDYYNDSKATNPEASIVAINSFPNKKVVLIAGGRDKKTSLEDFIGAIKCNISKVILIGEATERFKDELSKNNYMSIVNSKTLEEAIDIASLDRPDVVLLSPACASFDMFENYEKRGEAFKNYVLSKK